MDGFRVKRIDELQSIHGGMVKLAADELGVESFGLQVLDFPGGFEHYPEHDHAADGQEEVYVVLSGSCELGAAGERVTLDPGSIAWVAPGTRRRIDPGPDGVRILAIGCTVDGAYERPEDFRLAAHA